MSDLPALETSSLRSDVHGDTGRNFHIGDKPDITQRKRVSRYQSWFSRANEPDE
jgi:hypothetical protein